MINAIKQIWFACAILAVVSNLHARTNRFKPDARLLSADNPEFHLFHAKRNIFSVNAYLGFLSSSLRDREDELISNSNLLQSYPDGHVEQFRGNRLDSAFALNYERVLTRYWGVRATYMYGNLQHGMYIGGYNSPYAKESASRTLMQTHSILFGINFRLPVHRMHGFYLEVPLQVGINTGVYRPLVTYSNARTEYSYNLPVLENENTVRSFNGFQVRTGAQFAWYSAFLSVFAIAGLHYSYSYNDVEAGYKGSKADRIFERLELSIGGGTFL